MADLRDAGFLDWFRSWAGRPGCLLWLAALLVTAGAVSSFALAAALDLVGGPEERRGQAGGPTHQATLEATPAATPSAPPADPQWTVLLPDPAGGLPLVQSGGPELPHRESAMQQAGIPVTNLVGGQFHTDQVDSADWLLRLRADTETEPAG
jgi:hypothetical protein